LTVNLDRFAQGLPDPQDVAPLEYCQGCGKEIYPGEEVYVTSDGYILHCDEDCVIRFVNPQIMTIEEALK